MAELDIDGDGKADNAPTEDDIDGDGRLDGDLDEDDVDGDGKSDSEDDDEDGDGRVRANDDDDDGDGLADDDDDNGGVVVLPPLQIGDGTAPASLGVLVRVSKNTTEGPDAITFTSATQGQVQEAGEDSPDLFTFGYTSGGAEGLLRLTFKPGRYDDYTLDFASGRFVRKEYDRDVLKDSDFGSFDLGAAP